MPSQLPGSQSASGRDSCQLGVCAAEVPRRRAKHAARRWAETTFLVTLSNYRAGAKALWSAQARDAALM